MNKRGHEITKIPHRAIEVAEEEDGNKLTRTLASVCGFSVNLYLMMQVVKEVSDISRLFFALLLEFGILTMNQNILRPYVWILIGISLAYIKKFQNTDKYDSRN